jgi:hypothetical protein
VHFSVSSELRRSSGRGFGVGMRAAPWLCFGVATYLIKRFLDPDSNTKHPLHTRAKFLERLYLDQVPFSVKKKKNTSSETEEEQRFLLYMRFLTS